ncbi:DMT family transporter [uncultured Sphingomonas sp.]|uniref:DMT family transporter n=1 Tax=uncultured Sphingomonas sp. TaxID=158754 RepID=UPI0035CB9188
MRSYALLAAWSFLAGVGIPLIGVLNSGMARALGNPFAATAALFLTALLAASALTLAIHGAPAVGSIATAPARSYLAGLLIGFYALSATVIIPRFGAGNFIAFILFAQLVTSALLDHFGLLGLPKRPIDAYRLVGMVLLIVGLIITQWSALRNDMGSG